MQRRDFIKMGGLLAGSTQVGASAMLPGFTRPGESKGAIDFIHDGLALLPEEYATLLMKLADEGKIKPDYYSNGGVVEELEAKFAKLLGKESAVFMPTGTLANHIAVRQLANNKRRVIVQEQSHLYNNTGDCSQTLSGLTLIPLGTNATEFTLDEIQHIVSITKSGRVKATVGVISLESPVRQQHDCLFVFEKMKAIADYAKSNEIRMHLDGARLFVQSAHTSINPDQYASLFDTVYTALWKCFNSASGAVLAGTKSFTEDLFHVRRMFGGGLPAAWPFAAVALHFADGFIADYKKAGLKAEDLFSAIQKNERFGIQRFENGSHIVRLTIKNANLPKFRESLSKRQVLLNAPDENGFLLKINPSINRDPSGNLKGYFLEALKEA